MGAGTVGVVAWSLTEVRHVGPPAENVRRWKYPFISPSKYAEAS